MNKQDVIKALAILRVAYPAYRNESQADAMASVNLWTEMFQGEKYQIVERAIKEFIKNDTKGYPPTIGQINAIIVDLKKRIRVESEMKMIESPREIIPMPNEIKEKIKNIFKGVEEK